MSRSFIVVDLECTDKIISNAQILTGCFLHCDQDLNVIDRFDLQARPQIWDKSADFSTSIHGISRELAMSFPVWKKSGAKLVQWMKSKPKSYFVCHSNRTIFGKFYTYDYAVLKTQLFDLGLHWDLYRTCPERMIISTHSIAKHISHQMDLGSSLDLKSLSDKLGLKLKNHHNAESDALMCLEILKRLLPHTDLEEFFNKEYFKLQGDNDDTSRINQSRKTKSRKSKNDRDFDSQLS